MKIVQYSKLNESNQSNYSQLNDQNKALGLAAVLCTCLTAGFAGVYFEMMLKDGSDTPFWIRNLQMYLCGFLSTFFACFVTDSQTTLKNFFYGFNVYVWLIIGKLF